MLYCSFPIFFVLLISVHDYIILALSNNIILLLRSGSNRFIMLYGSGLRDLTAFVLPLF
jgi:hypothetical protein